MPHFCSPPARQIANKRAKNQQAVYFAQLELRVDFQELWRLHESIQGHETVFVKLVLPDGSQNDVDSYLASKGIDRSFIYQQ